MPGAAGQAVFLPTAPSSCCPASANPSPGPLTPQEAGRRVGKWGSEQGLPSAASQWGESSTCPVALAVCASYCVFQGADVDTWKC